MHHVQEMAPIADYFPAAGMKLFVVVNGMSNGQKTDWAFVKGGQRRVEEVYVGDFLEAPID